MSIRISIADDHLIVINGIKNMLVGHPHIILIATYMNGADLLAGLEIQLPDVLLLDIQMPDKTGDKLAPAIMKKYPELRILTLTNFDSIFYVKNMLQHGALGYLLKSTDEETLIKAIETVYAYEEFIEPSLKQQIEEKNLKTTRASVEHPVLTEREKEVIQLIANGYTTQKITETLHLSANTIDNYRSNLLLKFGVANTALLIKKAVQLGLVE